MQTVTNHRFCKHSMFFSDPTKIDAETLTPNQHLSEAEVKRLKNEQYRLSAYRSLIFWAYPKLRRGERRPLPACIYAMVRAKFPSVDDEEIYADFNHTLFTYEKLDGN